VCGYSQAAARSSERIVKILNLYAGIGGNRKLWGDEHEITAVECKPEIAAIYKDFFPSDEIVVADAHQFLLDHFREFDFIWSSPPCPSHSKARFSSMVSEKEWVRNRYPAVYPDMALYQEIILLQTHFRGKFCVENVIGYYTPLIKPVEFERHYWWVNFPMPSFRGIGFRAHEGTVQELERRKGFDLSNYSIANKRLLLRNCVEPELGKHILDWAMKPWEPNLRLAV
jgi:DNA (cytosine-5)-methyltransferase 1